MTYLQRELLMRPKNTGQSGTAHNCRGERTLDKQGDLFFECNVVVLILSPNINILFMPLGHFDTVAYYCTRTGKQEQANGRR